MTNQQKTATILIVDDTEQNVRLLAHVVKKEGYNVLAAFSGEDALDILEKQKPDIILLDVMMPDMDGFEVCKQVKERERVRDVPVIFLSALTETDSKVKGFEVGGVDYITKPFQREEVLARIRLHLRLTRLQNELEEKVNELKIREKRLDRLNKEKDELMRIFSHDIRNPVTGIIGISDILKDRIEEMGHDERTHMIQTIQESGNKILGLVNELLNKDTAERGISELDLQKVDLVQLIRQAAALHQPLAITKNITINFDIHDVPPVTLDKQKMDQVIGNLISNALKFTPENGAITIRLSKDDSGDEEEIQIQVSDSGIGIPEEQLESLFNVDNSNNLRAGTAGEAGSGMGLQLIKHYTELHNGQIEVDSEVEEGTTFTITLPTVYSEVTS